MVACIVLLYWTVRSCGCGCRGTAAVFTAPTTRSRYVFHLDPEQVANKRIPFKIGTTPVQCPDCLRGFGFETTKITRVCTLRKILKVDGYDFFQKIGWGIRRSNSMIGLPTRIPVINSLKILGLLNTKRRESMFVYKTYKSIEIECQRVGGTSFPLSLSHLCDGRGTIPPLAVTPDSGGDDVERSIPEKRHSTIHLLFSSCLR